MIPLTRNSKTRGYADTPVLDLVSGSGKTRAHRELQRCIEESGEP